MHFSSPAVAFEECAHAFDWSDAVFVSKGHRNSVTEGVQKIVLSLLLITDPEALDLID